jgi:hypothetical protein
MGRVYHFLGLEGSIAEVKLMIPHAIPFAVEYGITEATVEEKQDRAGHLSQKHK